MEKFRFHGDIHGKIKQFINNLSPERTNIQVGDFGFGFVPIIPELPHDTEFIRGNHDNPFLVSANDHYIEDGSIYNLQDSSKMMFIGGALSIDKHLRTQGLDWWPDEELSMFELDKMITLYRKEKPTVMVTHDCPQCISSEMFFSEHKRQYLSRTGQAFDAMWDIWQPNIWVFGHYHATKKTNIGGCLFQCIDELKYIDMEL